MVKLAQLKAKDGKLVDAWSDDPDVTKANIWIELGPRIVKLPCDDHHLADCVTGARYRLGAIDAYGKVIGKRAHMHCVDNREKFAPKVFKIYQRQKTGVIEDDKLKAHGIKKGDAVFQLVRVGEQAQLHDAIAAANDLMKGAA